MLSLEVDMENTGAIRQGAGLEIEKGMDTSLSFYGVRVFSPQKARG